MTNHDDFWDDSAGVDFYGGYDSNRTITVIENTPNRVRIRIKHKLDQTSGVTNNYLTNLDYIEIIYTIYPDRFVIDETLEASGTISIDSGDYLLLSTALGDKANLTNESNYYENSGVETETDSGTYNSADYLLCTSDELNFQLAVLDSNGWDLDQYSHSDGWFYIQVQESSLAAGTYTLKTIFIIDSAQRAGADKIYDSTDRLAMGDQYKDLIIS
jgi:hypothetical protein